MLKMLNRKNLEDAPDPEAQHPLKFRHFKDMKYIKCLKHV